jgi:hypothetical protein
LEDGYNAECEREERKQDAKE